MASHYDGLEKTWLFRSMSFSNEAWRDAAQLKVEGDATRSWHRRR